jgi:hypothetical protein
MFVPFDFYILRESLSLEEHHVDESRYAQVATPTIRNIPTSKRGTYVKPMHLPLLRRCGGDPVAILHLLKNQFDQQSLAQVTSLERELPGIEKRRVESISSFLGRFIEVMERIVSAGGDVTKAQKLRSFLQAPRQQYATTVELSHPDSWGYLIQGIG